MSRHWHGRCTAALAVDWPGQPGPGPGLIVTAEPQASESVTVMARARTGRPKVTVLLGVTDVCRRAPGQCRGDPENGPTTCAAAAGAAAGAPA